MDSVSSILFTSGIFKSNIKISKRSVEMVKTMKHLRQYIRQIILEMAMKQGIDLPPGWAFSCRITDTAYGMPQIHLVDADGYIDYDILKVECFFKEIFYTKNEETGEMEKDETAEKLGYRCFDLRRLD